MQKQLLYILFLISNITMAQTNLFEKKVNEQIIGMFHENNAYKTYFINTKKDTFFLDEFEGNPALPKSKLKWFNIINATIAKDTIIVLYYNFGLVQLKTYHFEEPLKMKVATYFIDQQSLISEENGGNINYFAEMNWIQGHLYCYINAQQQFGGRKTKDLYKFDLKKKKITIIDFQEDEDEKVVCIIDSKKMFREIDLDKRKEAVGDAVTKVLLTHKLIRKEAPFTYLGYIDVSDYNYDEKLKLRTSGMTYFFYQTSPASVKIIRYDNFDSQWLPQKYKEEDVKEAK
jgi:hypothetical protein